MGTQLSAEPGKKGKNLQGKNPGKSAKKGERNASVRENLGGGR